MSNFNFRLQDLNDPNKIAEAISGKNSERNLKTSKSKTGEGDPRDVTLFSMSQILMGIPGMKSGEEILAGIQQQIFSGIGTISGAIDNLGLSSLLPDEIRNVLGSLTPDGPPGPFSIYGPDGTVPAFDGEYSAESAPSVVKTISLADAEVGYQEEPPGSNKQKYAAIAGVPDGQPWCATFLMAIFRQAGFNQGNLLTPSTRETFANYQAASRVGDVAIPGSLVFFAYGGDTINHMGLVVGTPDSNTIETIEGNTSIASSGSQREGIAVARKKRNYRNVKGFAYPVYPGEPGIQLPYGGSEQGGFDPGGPPVAGGDGGAGTSYRWHPAQGASVDSKGPRPGASLLMKVVLEYFPGTTNLGIYNYRQIVGGSGLSVHSEGRALDIGVAVTDEGKALGDRVFRVLAPAAWSLGIQRIVWYRRIWQASAPSGKSYGGSHPHTDHLHVEMTREASTNLTEQQIRSIIGSYIGGTSFNIPAGA